jgi:hypothetical protein
MVENIPSPKSRIIADDQIIPGIKELFDYLRPSLIVRWLSFSAIVGCSTHILNFF